MYIKNNFKWRNTSFNSFTYLVKVGHLLYFKNMKETK